MTNEQIAKRLKQILIQKSIEIDTKIETMEILEDHVHLFVKTKPTSSGMMEYDKGARLSIFIPALWGRELRADK